MKLITNFVSLYLYIWRGSYSAIYFSTNTAHFFDWKQNVVFLVTFKTFGVNAK